MLFPTAPAPLPNSSSCCGRRATISLNGLFLLLEPEGVERDTSDLDNSESDTWQITDGMARTTETGDEDLVILIDEGHTTVAGDETGDSFVVLLELNSHTLSDGRVGLLGLDCDLFDDDTSSVRSALEGLSPLGDLVSLVEVVIGPSKDRGYKSELRYLFNLLWVLSLRPALIPLGFPPPIVA
jgi:hypothetical protein